MCLFQWLIERKEPKTIIVLPVRKTGLPIDIRNFFINPDVYELKSLNLNSVYEITNYVRSNIVTKLDDGEFWQFPFETLALKTGDCDDIAILTANLLRTMGYKDYEVRLNAGMAEYGSHLWVSINDKKGE